MKILKGLAIGLASFFLFLALPFLGLAIVVNSTALNPHFAIKEIQKLDVVEIARTTIIDQIPPDNEAYLSGLDKTITEIKPWMNRQIEYVVNRSYDYMLGKTDNLNFSINTEEIKPIIVENVTQTFLNSPPEEYNLLPAAEQNTQVADFQRQIDEAIPTNLEITQADIPQEVLQNLQQGKQIINYIRWTYFGLIAFCAILIVCIALIFRKPKEITLTLGVILLIEAILGLSAYVAMIYLIPQAIPTNDLPSFLQTWIPGLVRDTLAPWEIYDLILLGIGIILVVASILIGRHQLAPKAIEQPDK